MRRLARACACVRGGEGERHTNSHTHTHIHTGHEGKGGVCGEKGRRREEARPAAVSEA